MSPLAFGIGSSRAFGVGKSGAVASPPPSPPIVTSGLLLNLDAGDPASYSGTGTTWTDLTGNGNNATLTNSPTYSSSQGGYFTFNGSTNFAEVLSFNPPLASRTIETWIYVNTYSSTTQYIISNTVPGAPVPFSGFGFYTSNSIFTRSQGSTTSTSNSPASGSWHQVVMTVAFGDTTNASINFYLNGASVSGNPYNVSTSGSYYSAAGTTRWTIGGWATTDGSLQSGLNGRISIIRYYDNILSLAQIQQNRSAVIGRYS